MFVKVIMATESFISKKFWKLLLKIGSVNRRKKNRTLSCCRCKAQQLAIFCTVLSLFLERLYFKQVSYFIAFLKSEVIFFFIADAEFELNFSLNKSTAERKKVVNIGLLELKYVTWKTATVGNITFRIPICIYIPCKWCTNLYINPISCF